MVTTINSSAQGNRRKAKRSLQKVIKPLITAMAAIKDKTGKSATCDEVANVLHTIGKDSEGKDTKNPIFVDARDLGSYIAGAVNRMNQADNARHGTTLHKMAQTVLAKLQENSDASCFALTGGAASELEAFGAELGIDLDDQDELGNIL